MQVLHPTSKEKMTATQLLRFAENIDDDLSIAFGSDIQSQQARPSPLYVFTGESYEQANQRWFVDWQNGRWHLSLSDRTYDYRDNKFETLGKLITLDYTPGDC